MNNCCQRQLFGVLMLFAVPFAHAQSTAPVPEPISVPDRQAFQSYRSFTVEPITPWATANATVQKIGGWRTYAREGSESSTLTERESATTRAPERKP